MSAGRCLLICQPRLIHHLGASSGRRATRHPRRLGWCSYVRVCASILGQALQLSARARIAEDHIMASPHKYSPEFAAYESGAKNADFTSVFLRMIWEEVACATSSEPQGTGDGLNFSMISTIIAGSKRPSLPRLSPAPALGISDGPAACATILPATPGRGARRKSMSRRSGQSGYIKGRQTPITCSSGLTFPRAGEAAS